MAASLLHSIKSVLRPWFWPWRHTRDSPCCTLWARLCTCKTQSQEFALAWMTDRLRIKGLFRVFTWYTFPHGGCPILPIVRDKPIGSDYVGLVASVSILQQPVWAGSPNIQDTSKVSLNVFDRNLSDMKIPNICRSVGGRGRGAPSICAPRPRPRTGRAC